MKSLRRTGDKSTPFKPVSREQKSCLLDLHQTAIAIYLGCNIGNSVDDLFDNLKNWSEKAEFSSYKRDSTFPKNPNIPAILELAEYVEGQIPDFHFETKLALGSKITFVRAIYSDLN